MAQSAIVKIEVVGMRALPGLLVSPIHCRHQVSTVFTVCPLSDKVNGTLAGFQRISDSHDQSCAINLSNAGHFSDIAIAAIYGRKVCILGAALARHP
jgi:hypothetical protein